MDLDEIKYLIQLELQKAKKQHPVFYEDIIHAVGVMVEEAGESMQAALDCTYSLSGKKEVEKELIQTAAMCIRCLENLDNLLPLKSDNPTLK